MKVNSSLIKKDFKLKPKQKEASEKTKITTNYEQIITSIFNSRKGSISGTEDKQKDEIMTRY
jgi:hypothetical protein